MISNFKKRGMNPWGVRIAGSGGYLPGEPVSNRNLIDRYALDADDRSIYDRTGVRSRHFAPPEEAASHLAHRAALVALEEAGISPEDLDRIIFTSSTPDWTSPAAASNVQRLLGATCPAADTQAACASFIFGLDHGARLVATGMRYVLVVAAEVKSRFVRADDRALVPLFADGAGAFVLVPYQGNAGLLECELWSDGSYVHNMLTPAGGGAMPASLETVKQQLHTSRMQVEGRQIFDHAVEAMTELSLQVCAQRKLSPSDVDLFVPHQANIQIMKKVAHNLGIPDRKVVEVISRTGNIVSASIPFAYDDAKKKGRVKPGNLILMVTVGAGYAGGAALYQEAGE